MPEPRAAVVIATRDREARLRFALEALADQTAAASGVEVIVVRAPGSREPLARAPAGLEVRFLEAPRAGPAAQRNLGWRAASAPLVAFTDDDCRPSPGWLAGLLEASGPDVVVQGPTRPDPDEAHLVGGLARSVEVGGPSPWFEGCNIAYPRELLERLDGFDEAFPLAWGEDTDLGLRALESGATRRFAPAALVDHAVHARTPRAAFADARRRSWLPAVIARHPQQRRALYAGVFANRAHAALAAGIAIGALARRRPGATGLAALPFLAHNLAYNRGRGIGSPKGLAWFAAQMPARLATDLVELGSALEGSWRHRSLVV